MLNRTLIGSLSPSSTTFFCAAFVFEGFLTGGRPLSRLTNCFLERTLSGDGIMVRALVSSSAEGDCFPAFLVVLEGAKPLDDAVFDAPAFRVAIVTGSE